MKPFTKKKSIILYGCSGLGVNMLNTIVGSYLCSALLVGGFDAHVENWTFLNRDLVVAGLWAILILVAKIVDGLIDLPLSHFVDNLNCKWGKRKTAIVMGYIPMIIAYLLFSDWLISFSIMSSSCIHVVACGRVSFHFKA